jgi:sphinganine-1-phosphate aldolase
VHKYGYAAKGASTLIYRDMSYLKHQFFVSTDWSGGIYASPSMPGTRPGGAIAAAWAALQTMGEDGYKELAQKAWDASTRLRAGIEEIDGVRPLGPHHSTVVTWGADDEEIDIYAVADCMEEKGWSVDRQQAPPSVHCTVNANQLEVVHDYLSDLGEAVSTIRANPELSREGSAPMYGLMAKVPLRGLVKSSVVKVMEELYGPDGKVPDLSQLGAGKDDGLILEMMHKYGGRALDLMDYLRKLRRSIFGGGP